MSFIQRFLSKYRQFMYGRYGTDNLGKFMLIVVLIFFLLSMVTGLYLFYILALALLILSYVRMLSRNIQKRYSENMVYLRYKGIITAFFSRIKNRVKSKDSTHKIFNCPKCSTMLRVPKGKGKIKINCPKCGESFIKKT